MKFNIEQLALCPRDPKAAIQLLTEMGAGKWARDHVVAHGPVFGTDSGGNEADLAFEYQLMTGNELEILHYTQGRNWMDYNEKSVSHIGMHCTAEELLEWRAFFLERGIGVAQEVVTQSHTNPVIADSRRYQYVIFDTRRILSVDVKFIVRLPVPAPISAARPATRSG